MPTESEIRKALSTVKYPGYSRDIVSFGMVSGVAIHGSKVILNLTVSSGDPAKLDELHVAAAKAVGVLPGVSAVEVNIAPPAQAPKAAPEGPAQPQRMPGVQKAIAVGSGKGGVGKTTVAVNLAVALAERGLQVGLLDADVYGPNVPRMLGVQGQPRESANGKIKPLESFGVKIMSIGFFVDTDTAVIWRGPMVGKLIDQFINDVDWGNLDILLIDLPPGTGDAQLSLTQALPLDGAIVVTTPQHVAVEDAMRGLLMFQKVNVPIVGVVENMSYFVCPHCGQRTDIFAHGGGESETERLGVPFLGEIPLDATIRQGGDEGKPILKAAPQSVQAEAFRKIAERIAPEAKPRTSNPLLNSLLQGRKK